MARVKLGLLLVVPHVDIVYIVLAANQTKWIECCSIIVFGFGGCRPLSLLRRGAHACSLTGHVPSRPARTLFQGALPGSLSFQARYSTRRPLSLPTRCLSNREVFHHNTNTPSQPPRSTSPSPFKCFACTRRHTTRARPSSDKARVYKQCLTRQEARSYF